MTHSTGNGGAAQTDPQSPTLDDIQEQPGIHNDLLNDNIPQPGDSSSTTDAGPPSAGQRSGESSNQIQVVDFSTGNADAAQPSIEPHTEISEDRSTHELGTFIPNKYFQMRWIIIFCFGMIAISVLLFIYFYDALVSKNPTTLGPLLFSPSRTLLVVTIFSQVHASAIRLLFNTVFDALRWQMVSNQKGVSLKTFLGLSSATSLLGVFRLLHTGGEKSHIFWCAQRLFLPALSLFVSVVLKSDFTFKNVYSPLQTANVLAGIAPINVSLLKGHLPTSVIAILFSTYTNSILGSSSFVTGMDPVSCSGTNCTSIFLPGGIFNARRLIPGKKPNLNMTLLSDDLLTNASAIVINNAPGYQVEFSPMDENFEFWRNNCTMYGQTQGEGLYICISSDSSGIVAGWSACVADIVGSCFVNTSWANPLQQTTSLRAYKRYATVAYDTRNLSILSVESISSPEPVEIDPFQLQEIFSAVLTPLSNGSSEDNDLANTLLIETGWALRLYRGDFGNSLQLPLDLFRGFLLVPIQFATVAWMWVNSTEYYTNTTAFALPPDLETTAYTAKLTYRAVAATWTVAAFIAVVCVLLIWGTLLLLYVLWNGVVTPNTSLFVEVDVSSKSKNPLNSQSAAEDGVIDDFSTMLRDAGIGNSESRAILRLLKEKRIRLLEVNGERDERFLVLVDVTGKRHELEDLPSPSQGTAYL